MCRHYSRLAVLPASLLYRLPEPVLSSHGYVRLSHGSAHAPCPVLFILHINDLVDVLSDGFTVK